MPCDKLMNNKGEHMGFICSPNVYKVPFKGKDYIFEWHDCFGPTWLTKKLETRKHPWPSEENHPFYEAVNKLQKMTDKERETYLI